MRAWFLKIDMVRTSVCVCVCLCVSAPRAIKNYSREMKPEKPIKQVLLPFSFSVRHLLIDTVDGRGLSNDRSASCVTSKEEQGNAVFAVHYTVKAV